MEKLTTEFKIEFTKGDTYALAIKFKNITEDLRKAYFSVKENPDDIPLIQKTLGAGINKIDDRAYKKEKTYKFQIQPADTVNLEAKVQYLYDIQVSVGNVVKTVLHGVFVLGNTITGTKSVTQEMEVAIDDELEVEVLTTPATNGVEYETDPVACAKIGDLTKLDTDNKETVVKAINEVNKNADTNAEDINKIKNGTIELPSVKNVSKTINGKNISDIFESNGTTVKKSTKSTIADYASNDTSKGTIEERLTRLGFKQGTMVVDSAFAGLTVENNEIKRQGNYVIFKFKINGSTELPYATSVEDVANLGTLPADFQPSENVEFFVYGQKFYKRTSTEVTYGVTIGITQDGIVYTTVKSIMSEVLVGNIEFCIGYEAKTL